MGRVSIIKEFWDFLILHNHYELAYKYELFGVHCTAENEDLNHAFIKSYYSDNYLKLCKIF